MARNYDTSRTGAEIVKAVPDPMGVRDVRFTKAEWVEGKGDKDGFLSIEFKQEGSGALANFLLSDVDPKRYSDTEIYSDKRGPDKQGRTKYAKACDDQDALLKHMFGAITGIDYNDKPIKDVNSFEEYIKAFIATINVESARKVRIYWIKLSWYLDKQGQAKVSMSGFPPLISSELKPRDWNPSQYDIDRKIFTRPVSVTVANADHEPDEEEVDEEVITNAQSGSSKPAYDTDDDEEVEDDSTELEDDDEGLV